MYRQLSEPQGWALHSLQVDIDLRVNSDFSYILASCQLSDRPVLYLSFVTSACNICFFSVYRLYLFALKTTPTPATGTLLVPRARTATGQWSFAVNGPATWNRLPPALQSPDLSESAFKQALKTHLFSTARRHWDVFMILALHINIHQTYCGFWTATPTVWNSWCQHPLRSL